MLDFVCLLDLNADSDTVDARLNQDSLIFVSRYSQRVQQDFRGCLRFNFWHVMTFRCLGCEIREAQGGG
jgi:hypothetical protein